MSVGNTIIFALIALLIIYIIVKMIGACYLVREKEVIVIESFGKFKKVLHAGFNITTPFVDRPKKYWYRYLKADTNNVVGLHERHNMTRINIAKVVEDFAEQSVISKDNASVVLDATISYYISNPQKMIYSTVNLPQMISKLLQAQLRNVAGMFEVDQLIEDASITNTVQAQMQTDCARWGVTVEFVKIAQVKCGSLEKDLEKKKTADLNNEKLIIDAKGTNSTTTIEAQGIANKLRAESEGMKQEVCAKATGQAEAVVNRATAEARSIAGISAAIKNVGDPDPIGYFMSVKYLQVLNHLIASKKVNVDMLPSHLANLQTMKKLGMNSVIPK
ncbi:hypothetical protein PCE1_004410 [Barthelona sp. PCE]